MIRNDMSTDEAVEISGIGILAIRNAIRKGIIIGSCIDEVGSRRKTYRISRFAFYRRFLGWNEQQIEDYHRSNRGKFWLNKK